MDQSLLLASIGGGLLNSLYPCGITVLLLFISILFMLEKDRKTILRVGLSYILAVYVTYFFIGLGLLKTVSLFGIPTILPKIIAVFIIIFGLLNAKEYFFPNAPFKIRMPLSARHIISEWAYKASIPAAIIMGILVAFVGLPCSGSIYFSIIGLISLRTTFIQGAFYLLVYDFFFVIPLVVIFLITTNRLVAEKMINLNEQHGRKLHLVLATVMILFGTLMLVI